MTDSLREKLEEAAEALAAYIRECDLIPEEKRGELSARMGEIQRAIQAADRPLRLALLGGTGVGKSTIINALAGEVISPGSRRRPTTTRIVVYAHKDWREDGDLDLNEEDQVRRHEERAIRDLLIVDFPDFDSLREEGRRTVDSYLPQMDQILWVVDKEKYNDRRLHDGYIRREAPYRQNFLFLFNKVDAFAGREEELDVCVQSLRETLSAEGIESPLLFGISAKHALLGKGGHGGEPVGEFSAFEEHLRTRYTEKYRAEIRKANVLKALGTLVDEVGTVVRPDEGEEQIREARQQLAEVEKALLREAERLVVDESLSRERQVALAGVLQRKYLEDLPGVVGLIAESRLFGRAGPSPQDLAQGEKGPRKPAGGIDSFLEGSEESAGARRLYTLLVNAAHDLGALVRRPDRREEIPVGKAISEEGFRERLQEAFQRVHEGAREALDSRRFVDRYRLLQHLLPWGVAGLIAYFTLKYQEALNAEGALHWVLIEIPLAIVIIYFAEAALAHRGVRREARRRVAALRETLVQSLRDTIREDLITPTEHTFAIAESTLTRFREIGDTIRNFL